MTKRNLFKVTLASVAFMLATATASFGAWAATQKVVTATDTIAFVADKQIDAEIKVYLSADDTVDAEDKLLGSYVLSKGKDNSDDVMSLSAMNDADQKYWVRTGTSLTEKTNVIVIIENKRSDDKIDVADGSTFSASASNEQASGTHYVVPSAVSNFTIAESVTSKVVYEYSVDGLADVDFSNSLKYTLVAKSTSAHTHN